MTRSCARRCVLSRSCIQCKVNANRLRCQGSHRWQKGSSFAPLDPPWIRHCWMSCLYIHDTVPYGLMHRAYIISLTKMFTHTVLYISLFFNRIIPLRIMANWICHDIHLQFWTSQSCSWGGISSRRIPGLKGQSHPKQDPPIERDLMLTLEEVCIKKMEILRKMKSFSV